MVIPWASQQVDTQLLAVCKPVRLSDFLLTEMSYLRIPARINTHAHMQTIPITCKTLIVYITKPMNILLECYLLFPLSFLYFHIP